MQAINMNFELAQCFFVYEGISRLQNLKMFQLFCMICLYTQPIVVRGHITHTIIFKIKLRFKYLI